MVPSALPPSLIGRQIGPYRVGKLLGRGGMGEVYEAVHGSLGQRAAVKVLHPRVHRTDALERFFREARAVSQIEAPGLVKVYDHGQLEDGVAYILMEYLPGESLRARLARLREQGQQMAPEVALRFLAQAAAALAAAHAAGVVHRDIKPDNVFLVPDAAVPGGERAKVLDFGIAKFLTSDAEDHTTSGVILGTPRYMAPEQCDGSQQLSDRVDVYALGAVGFEMLAGRPPFLGETGLTVMRQHMVKPPPSLRTLRAGLPAGAAELIEEMLAKDPTRRPGAAAVAHRCDAVLRGAARGSRPGPAVLGASLLVAAGLALVLLQRGRQAPPGETATQRAAPVAPAPVVPAAAPPSQAAPASADLAPPQPTVVQPPKPLAAPPKPTGGPRPAGRAKPQEPPVDRSWLEAEDPAPPKSGQLRVRILPPPPPR